MIGPRVKNVAKRMTEMVVVRGRLYRLAHYFRGQDSVILAYHNIVPDRLPPSGDRSLHLQDSSFVKQLNWLKESYEVVPLEEILNERHPGSRPRAAITFDDAYKGAVTIGVRRLLESGLPATIFVAPSLIGTDGFWWDRVAGNKPGAVREFRTHVLDKLGGSGHAAHRWARENGMVEQELPQVMQPAAEAELESLQDMPGIQLGSHTWSHPNLSKLSSEQVREEICKSLLWMRERYSNAVAWLAYPYGLPPRQMATMVSQAGYDGAVCASGGRFCLDQSGPRRYVLPRVNVAAGASEYGFILRATGVVQ